MKTQMKFFWLASIAMVVVALYGCAPQQPSAGENVENKAMDNKVSVADAKPHPKPGASVSLANKEPFVIEQNVPAEVTLVLLALESRGVMDIQVSVSDELVLNSPSHQQLALSSSGRYELPVTITADHAGRYYINLHISMSVNGRQSSRVLSAIVQVGDKVTDTDLQKALPAGANAGLDEVVSMPAQETIIP